MIGSGDDPTHTGRDDHPVGYRDDEAPSRGRV